VGIINVRIFAVIIFSIVFLISLVEISSVAALLPSWLVLLGVLEMASLVMVAYWVYSDDERMNGVFERMPEQTTYEHNRVSNEINSLDERLRRIEKLGILEKELNALKKELTEEKQITKISKVQKMDESLLDEVQIENYRLSLLEKYKVSGFLKPEENLEYEIDRKMGLGKTRNKAIEELHKEKSN
jgi:hypothetical protein